MLAVERQELLYWAFLPEFIDIPLSVYVSSVSVCDVYRNREHTLADIRATRLAELPVHAVVCNVDFWRHATEVLEHVDGSFGGQSEGTTHSDFASGIRLAGFVNIRSVGLSSLRTRHNGTTMFWHRQAS